MGKHLRAIKKPPKHNTMPLNGDYSKLFKAVCRNTRPYYGLIQSNFCTRQKIVLIKVIKTLAIVANNITIVNKKRKNLKSVIFSLSHKSYTIIMLADKCINIIRTFRQPRQDACRCCFREHNLLQTKADRCWCFCRLPNPD